MSAPRCAYREDTRQTDPAAAEELWAAQLAFCAPGEAFASRAFSGDDRIIRSLPEATSTRTRPLILLPLRPGWPRVDTKGRKGVPATRKASSDSEDEPDIDGKRGDASFAARRAPLAVALAALLLLLMAARTELIQLGLFVLSLLL